MKKLSTKLLLLTLLFGLIGCISENNFEQETEQDITFRVIQTTNTRGISRPIPDGERLEFNTGDLFMVTAEGVIVRHFNIVEGTALTATTVGVSNLLTGVTIESVPSSIARVVIIGNNSGAAFPTTGQITGNNFLGRTLDVVSQHSAWNVNLTNCPVSRFERTTDLVEIVNGNLYQRTAANPATNTRALYATTVHLAPTVARFEIADITGMGRITSFTVDGIFMDGIYLQARIDGTPVGALHSGGIIANNFTRYSHFNAPIGDADFGIHDWRTRETTRYRDWSGYISNNPATLTVRPDNVTSGVWHPRETTGHNCICVGTPCIPGTSAGICRPRNNTWAYQVFARDYNETLIPVAATPTPRIIIRLSDVRLMPNNELWNGDGYAFLTVGNFHYIRNNQRFPLTHIRASRVYRIEAGWLTFDETDLDYIPNREPIDVQVTVQLAAWREVNLGVII